MKRITDFIKKIQSAQFITDEESEQFDNISVSLGDNWYLLDELNSAVNEGQLADISVLESRIQTRLTKSTEE